MKRYFVLALLLLSAFPVGISVIGCGTNRANSTNYCQDGTTLVTAVTTLVLQPQFSSISLANGQTHQFPNPTASNCNGTPVAVSKFAWATGNPGIVTISPSGNVCGGTWEINRGGGVPDYTICDPPTGTAAVNGGASTVSAGAAGVVSNGVVVYVHPAVTSVVLNPQSGATCSNQFPAGSGQIPACLSQGEQQQLTALVCAGSVDITSEVGQLNYTASSPTVVSISTTGVATAAQPGATAIVASASTSGSTAGYFYTCPPASIALTVPGFTITPGVPITIFPNNTKQITAQIVDTKGKTITGLSLTYSSANPFEIPVSNNGLIAPVYPSTTDLYATCQPPTCNTAPIDQIGVNGNGLPVISNPIGVTAPGLLTSILYLANLEGGGSDGKGTGSTNVAVVNNQTNTVGSAIRLPYIPNSMVLSQDTTRLWFGSDIEIMSVATSSNTVASQDMNVQGKVLAVSPDGLTVVITDPRKQLIYLYSSANGSYTTFGDVGQAAKWSPDSRTLYIAAGDHVDVYSNFTGWQSYSANSTDASDVALTIPGVGAFFSGNPTTARAYCPNTTVTPNINYPTAATVDDTTQPIASSLNGQHIVGAVADGDTVSITDIVPTLPPALTESCPTTNTGLVIPVSTPPAPPTATGKGVEALHDVLIAPNSSIAFFPYYGDGAAPAVLPFYQLAAPGANNTAVAGTPGSITLSGAATAPQTGAWSPDSNIFFVSTSGDNLLHFLTFDSTTGAYGDTKQVDPKLTDSTTNLPIPADAIAVVPYKVQS